MKCKTYRLLFVLILCVESVYMPCAQAHSSWSAALVSEYTEQTITTAVLIAMGMLVCAFFSGNHARRGCVLLTSLKNHFGSPIPFVVTCSGDKESIQQDVRDHAADAQEYYPQMRDRLPLDLRAQVLSILDGNVATLFAQWAFTEHEKQHNAYKQALSMSADIDVQEYV